jgi:hypothetical protein
MNGKKFTWQAVCLLPWIDEKRLLREIAAYEHTFTGTSAVSSATDVSLECMFIDDEKYRNADGIDYLFFLTSHPLANFASYLYLNESVDVNWSALTDVGETHMFHGFIRGYPSAFIPGTLVARLVAWSRLLRLHSPLLMLVL